MFVYDVLVQLLNRSRSPFPRPLLPTAPSSVQRNSYHGYLQIAVVIRRYKLVQTAVAVGGENDFTGGVRIVILGPGGSTWTATTSTTCSAGPSVPSCSPIAGVMRLNCRSSVAAVFGLRSTAGLDHRLQLRRMMSHRRKRIDLVAKQRIVPAATAASADACLAVFVDQRRTGDIDDHVVVVVVVVILGGRLIIVLVGVLKVVRVEDAAV